HQPTRGADRVGADVQHRRAVVLERGDRRVRRAWGDDAPNHRKSDLGRAEIHPSIVQLGLLTLAGKLSWRGHGGVGCERTGGAYETRGSEYGAGGGNDQSAELGSRSHLGRSSPTLDHIAASANA